MDFSECEFERVVDNLIRRARASQWASNIFADAEELHRIDGYCRDVALVIACKYWLS